MTSKVLRRQLAFMVAAALMTAAAATAQDIPTSSDEPGTSEATGFRLPVSIERIRVGLERKSGLTLSLGRFPTFRVRTEGITPFDLDKAARSLSVTAPGVPFSDSPRGSSPAAGIDLWPLIRGFVSRTTRAIAERNARETVRRAMQAFCAAHPDQRDDLPDCAGVERVP